MSNEFWYLATPYSKWPHGIHDAFCEAAKAAAEMLKRGHIVYSPIAHTHPIATHGGIDPLDHSIWLPFDGAMMAAAAGLYVVQMPGWDQSKGIAHEIAVFEAAGKPVHYVTWPDLIDRPAPGDRPKTQDRE